MNIFGLDDQDSKYFSFFETKKQLILKMFMTFLYTGKSLSEALIFVSTYQQYDDRLFIELQVQ